MDNFGKLVKRLVKKDLTSCLIWGSNHSAESNSTPKLYTVVEGCTITPSILIQNYIFLLNFVPTNRISVFSVFNFKNF